MNGCIRKRIKFQDKFHFILLHYTSLKILVIKKPPERSIGQPECGDLRKKDNAASLSYIASPNTMVNAYTSRESPTFNSFNQNSKHTEEAGELWVKNPLLGLSYFIKQLDFLRFLE